jgi:hypothetical protein
MLGVLLSDNNEVVLDSLLDVVRLFQLTAYACPRVRLNKRAFWES